MDRLDRDRIADMLEHAQLAVSIVGPADPQQLAANKIIFLAAQKAIEIVGEAANQISSEARADLPQVPWTEAIRMRHKLVHGYRSVRAEVIVGTVRNDLPPLIDTLRRALEKTAP